MFFDHLQVAQVHTQQLLSCAYWTQHPVSLNHTTWMRGGVDLLEYSLLSGEPSKGYKE